MPFVHSSVMENASAYLRDEVERQDRGEPCEKKLPLIGVDPLAARARDEVRALVCCPWGGRKVKILALFPDQHSTASGKFPK